MFTGVMTGAWLVGSVVAVVAGAVGFFVVLRSSVFAAHAIPNGAFAGAAAAALIGFSPLLGLAGAAVLAAGSITLLGRRGRHDVATALALVLLLALGAALLSATTDYAGSVFGLLFGQLVGVGSGQLLPVGVLAVSVLAAMAVLYRPLLLSSVLPEVATARGVRRGRVELAFLLLVAVATALTVPVVGTLLVFSLMTGPPAAARSLLARPLPALGASAALALLTTWASIAASYASGWPVGFFVGVFSLAVYLLGRAVAGQRRGSAASSTEAAVAVSSRG